ncbi:hypothetical protein ATER59S_02146 [Aquamicrobium terrae]
MNLLLDTHVLAWWVLDDARLSVTARNLVADPSNRVVASAVSAFEMATKHRLGKWPDVGAFVAEFGAAVAAEGFGVMAVTADHAVLAGSLAGEPRDPFDRLIAAQAIVEKMPVVSADPALAMLGAQALW